MPRPASAEQHDLLGRLQRNGGALSPCECGSRSWLPPDGVYHLVRTDRLQQNSRPAKAIVPISCAACGLTKFYDPAVVAGLAESNGRW